MTRNTRRKRGPPDAWRTAVPAPTLRPVRGHTHGTQPRAGRALSSDPRLDQHGAVETNPRGSDPPAPAPAKPHPLNTVRERQLKVNRGGRLNLDLENIVTSTHGRRIGAFRTSGVNTPGYSRQQPQQAPQQAPEAPQQRPMPGTLRIGPGRPSPRMQAHIANVKNVTAGPPPRVPKDGPTVTVFLDGERVRLPSDWTLAFSSAKDRDVVYALEPSGALHVLVIHAGGELRELQGLTTELIDDIYRWKFPGVRR